MNCDLMEKCAFFNEVTSHIVDPLKQNYCKENSFRCARRWVSMAIGEERVPANLFPDHMHRVDEIIDSVLSK